ncbi:MAG TPA: NCS2 family permease [Deltaproteobacteria bacterium]|nr:NCS2 family permease [Deltaproteobacteria bacterium]HQB38179.1 NCS2 family permease [Deltaproteobacteria bacterium]
MQKYFEFERFGTTYRKEIIAGVTTFMTMAYIIVINPAILKAAGIPEGPSMTATIISAAFGTLVMGVYAKRPFAIAPYMGENAFIAYTVVKVMGYTWQVALGAIFLAGLLFTALTVMRVRGWLAESIPLNLKYSFSVGIGLFLTFIGLNEIGMVTLGVPGAPVCLGKMSAPPILLSVAGFTLMAWLMVKRVWGALMIGILAISLISFATGITPLPKSLAGMPSSLSPIMGQLDIIGALSPKAFPVVMIIFVMVFVDTIGTLIGLSARAGLLDQRGNLPEIERPMLADAVSNMAAPLLGTTTTGAYIESAAGIEEGGKTGFTALVVAGLFLLSLFISPLLTAVPPHAYGPALVLIGCMMIRPVAKLDFDDYTELIPSFLTISLVSFTFNIGVGITAGLLAYPLLKTITGRSKEVPPPLWILAGFSLLFYISYPYH